MAIFYVALHFLLAVSVLILECFGKQLVDIHEEVFEVDSHLGYKRDLY